MKLVPLYEYEWTDDYSYQRTLTCVNHPDAVFGTKNPFDRSIHVRKESESGECNCPFSDLRVVVSE